MDKEKISIDWGGVRGAAWMGSSGIIAGVANQLFMPGGLLNRLGAGGPAGGPGAPVTREVLDLKVENQGLKSQLYTNELDKRQSVWNAEQQGRIDCLQRQVNELYTLTKLTVPNGNLTPGVGPVQVVPVTPPVPDVTALAAAIAAAMQKPASAGGSGS